MKIRNFITASLALALGFGVAVGARQASRTEEVKADSTYSVYLEFSADHWNANSKVCCWFSTSDDSASKFGHLELRGEGGSTARYMKYSEELGFVPEKMVVFKVTPEAVVSGDWLWNDSDPGLWAKTSDISVNDAVWVGNYYPDSKYVENGSYPIQTRILGWDYETATESVVNSQLSNEHIKLSGDLEIYGVVDLPKCQFKSWTQAGNSYYGAFAAHASVADRFIGDGDNNIKCEVAGSYEFYFNFTTKTLWIQMSAEEEAKSYADGFLSNITCNGSSVTAAEGAWGEQKTAYEAMSESARGYLTAATADEDGSEVEQAVARYDFILKKYNTKTVETYEDFMGRVAAGKVVLNDSFNYGVNAAETNYIYLIIIATSLVITTVGCLLILKKKKTNK